MGADALATRPVREADGRGRHTTARRELLLLPGGGLVIDTPGLREVAVWEDGGALAEAFSDIEGLAASCAFRDCSHTVEPGCAVLRAVAERRLEAGRLESFVRLRSELRRTAERRDVRFRLEQKRKWKTIHKTARHFRPRGFE
jgi:ribosome biogenesis GTPase